jgi:hypothetical protein
MVITVLCLLKKSRKLKSDIVGPTQESLMESQLPTYQLLDPDEMKCDVKAMKECKKSTVCSKMGGTESRSEFFFKSKIERAICSGLLDRILHN